ncbi:hypothetical protein [Actinomadura sp. WMMB 499]|uniref:hypothetical protein n=1 Tax=Actinomadura sp. WMMB 499 TaxID=1219491 RepID=UPI0012465052|nr:hypothetical protein [Actinomadura sp. WMMB 499]QFG26503.1 hypothetical protein F7P10_40585 [Actinomadura sp. WMMB 499]
MHEDFVITRLCRLGRVLGLAREPRPGGTPAVLVIPRGGRLRAPRLVLFGGPGAPAPHVPGSPAAADAHTVAHLDAPAAAARRESADVLVGRALRPPFGTGRLRRVLERYPGCGVAVAAGRGGPAAALRGGGTVRACGSAASWPCAEGPVGAGPFGSLLFAWTSAGLTVADLAGAVVIAGTLGASDRGRPGPLHVSGRISVVPAGGARRRAAS